MAKYVTINTKVKKIVRRGAPGPASATPDPTFDSVTLNTAASPPASPAQAQMWWDADEETYSMKQDGTTLQLGQEIQWNVRNNSGSTIVDGTPVMATGSIGASGRITIAPMDGTDPNNAKLLLGIATEEIINGEDGKVSTFGKIRNIQTNGGQYGETWVDGELIYISPYTIGDLTNVLPTTGELMMPVSFVINSSATNGTIGVRVTPIDEGLLLSLAQKAAVDGSNTPSATNIFETRNESESAEDATAGGTVTLDVISDNVFITTTDDTAFTIATTGEADSRGITLVLNFTAALPTITWPTLANTAPDISGATPTTGKAVIEMAYLDGEWWAWLVEAI